MKREDSLKVISQLSDAIAQLYRTPVPNTAIIRLLEDARSTVQKDHEKNNIGLNYDANAVQWMPGDLVLHDADRKERDFLMVVIGYDTRTGECKTRYTNPTAFASPKRRVYRNSLRVLHDPGRFGIAVPNTLVRELEIDE